MTITQIDIYQSPIKLKEPFVISLGPLAYAENVVTVIQTKEGFKGFGECSPFKTINGESMETCFVVASYLARVLMGKNPLEIENCIKLMDAVIYGNSSIKSAFDMALFDLAAQHAGLPLYAFLGGNNQKALFTDYTVSIREPEEMAAKAKQIQQAGYPVLKVKLGGSLEKDVERIRMIRDAIGYTLPIRIDANQGWDVQTAHAILKALAPYQIQHCEEPIARWNFMALPEIRKQSPIPIMADESCCDPHDAQRLIDLEACDSLNVKLGKSGGIYKALQIIELAEKANMKVQIGGFLESRLGFTASAHLALCCDSVVYCDFDTPLMLSEDPVSGGILYGENGRVHVPEIPGLGAWIEPDYLEGLRKMSVSDGSS